MGRHGVDQGGGRQPKQRRELGIDSDRQQRPEQDSLLLRPVRRPQVRLPRRFLVVFRGHRHKLVELEDSARTRRQRPSENRLQGREQRALARIQQQRDRGHVGDRPSQERVRPWGAYGDDAGLLHRHGLHGVPPVPVAGLRRAGLQRLHRDSHRHRTCGRQR